MGFRFRRSVRLIPGVRLNVSGNGASLSVGGSGATLNFSSRGARATFGIPGSGLSYSTPMFRPQEATRRAIGQTTPITSTQQLVDAVRDPRTTVVYAKSQRRLSASQLAAAYRELATQELRSQNLQQVARMEAEERAVLESWREEAGLLSPQEHANALHPRPFLNPEAAPTPPNYVGAEIVFRERAHDQARTSMPRSAASRSAGSVAGLLAAVAIGVVLTHLQVTPALLVVAAFGGGLGVAVILSRITKARWERDVEAETNKRISAEWPGEHERLEAQHAAALQAHATRTELARAAWDETEAARVEWAVALTSGDLEVIEQTVLDSLEEIDFPFESECAIGAEGASSIFVNLDLPEIEVVVPEMRFNVLKNGTLKEVKRKADERNAAYAGLASGIVLAVAATVFSAAPTVQSVTIAAFTQRKRRGAGHIDDAYVLESRITRDVFAAAAVQTGDPIELLGRFQTRIDWGASFLWKKIPAPSWVHELQS